MMPTISVPSDRVATAGFDESASTAALPRTVAPVVMPAALRDTIEFPVIVV